MKDSILTEIYKDALSPIAKQAGITLGEVTKLILSPIYEPTKYLNIRIENWFKRIEKEVPQENRIEAAANITIPTLQNLALNQDESLLGEMFYSILKCSIDKTKQKFLSPAFPKILEQLTRDEAVMLLLLQDRTYKVEHYSSFDYQKNIFYDRKEVKNEFPVSKLQFPDNLWLYNDHLNHLNLSGCWEYKRQDPVFSEKQIEIGTGAFTQMQNIQIGNKEFHEFKLTDFGKNFAEVCITDKCKDFI